MNSTRDKLWPFGKMAALLAIPAIWIVFGGIFIQTHKNLGWPDDKQIPAMLEFMGSYVVLVRDGKYERLLSRSAGERLILRQLFLQAQEGK